MKLRIVSDLHLDFYKDYRPLLDDITAGDYDVLIVAGDMCESKLIPECLKALASRVREDRHLVYVLGNHEAYGAMIRESLECAKDVSREYDNVHVLDDSSVTIRDQRFIGSTLWFTYDRPRGTDQYMADFSQIMYLRQYVHHTAETSYFYLMENVREDDVVITHHLPHERSIADKYKRNELNAYFLHDCSQIIKRRAPKLWIHGHTHCSFDYMVPVEDGSTRVVCNPLGYPIFNGDEPNRHFNTGMTLDLSEKWV